MPVIACCVKNGGDNNYVFCFHNFVNHAIRKFFGITPADDGARGAKDFWPERPKPELFLRQIPRPNQLAAIHTSARFRPRPFPLLAEIPPASSFYELRAQAGFHRVQRHGGRGIFAVRGETFFHQYFIGRRQRRVIQIQRATDKQLPFAQGERWQFLQHFRKTHIKKFNPLCLSVKRKNARSKSRY